METRRLTKMGLGKSIGLYLAQFSACTIECVLNIDLFDPF